MPNWCECELRIEGKKKELAKFKEFAKTKKNVLDTEKFIPYPKKFKDLDEKSRKLDEKRDKMRKRGKSYEEAEKKYPYMKDGFNSGGYEWCNDNWGTKWGICDAELIEDYGDELNYEFNTAWSPPEPVIIKMSKMFPKLKFTLTYYEVAMQFNGILICEKGKIIEQDTGKYFGHRGG